MTAKDRAWNRHRNVFTCSGGAGTFCNPCLFGLFLTSSTNIYGVNVPCKRQLLSVMIFFKPRWSHSCSLLIFLFVWNVFWTSLSINHKVRNWRKTTLFQLLTAFGLSCDLPAWILHNHSLTLHSGTYWVFFTTQMELAGNLTKYVLRHTCVSGGGYCASGSVKKAWKQNRFITKNY